MACVIKSAYDKLPQALRLDELFLEAAEEAPVEPEVVLVDPQVAEMSSGEWNLGCPGMPPPGKSCPFTKLASKWVASGGRPV